MNENGSFIQNFQKYFLIVSDYFLEYFEKFTISYV